ncbi:fungal-specific transcription factor domain-containing protein [Trichoderma sp. TUCIM 5745]
MAPPVGSPSSRSGPGMTSMKRKRGPRAAVACDSCRTRKVKCDGQCPCSSCQRHSFQCSYDEKPQFIVNEDVDPNADYTWAQSHDDISTKSIATVRPEEQAGSQVPGSWLSPVSPANPISGQNNIQTVQQHRAHEYLQQTPGNKDLGGSVEPRGLGEVNKHTEGAEFYGPTGTFYFLSKLRSRAQSQSQSQSRRDTARDDRERPRQRKQDTSGTSVVNLLHSSEYSVAGDTRRHSVHSRSPMATFDSGQFTSHEVVSQSSTTASRTINGQTDVERECVRLYFQNLHCVHPILDQSSFVDRCEREHWRGSTALIRTNPASSPNVRDQSRFLALFNSVLALGAITAGETSSLTWDSTKRFLDISERREGIDPGESLTTFLPIRVARLYFEKAKLQLEDVFESSSFETIQTLFLMSVFSQNALKPHSCYMYSGMALRGAFAIGLPTNDGRSSHEERLLWWALYSHEIEMCSSAGRMSFLRELGYYSVPYPEHKDQDEPCTHLIRCMAELADIHYRIATETQQYRAKQITSSQPQVSKYWEAALDLWHSGLPPELNLDTASLDEPQRISKQKVVLKLRYLNAKILMHRSFLISSGDSDITNELSSHTACCIAAARSSIQLVHTTYLNRPYFRTWWYNCTYVLDATMVLLYVILSQSTTQQADDIVRDIEKSLEIFKSMKALAVARRCFDITEEVLNAVKRNNEAASRGRQAMNSPVDGRPSSDDLHPDTADQGLGTWEFSQEELFASLVDTNLVFNFLNAEDWNAWSHLS